MSHRAALFVVVAVLFAVGCEQKPGGANAGSANGSPSGSAAASGATAVAPNPNIGKEVVLFNGKDLTGWVVTECETEVKDAVLLLKAGEGWIRAEKPYTNFELSWECKNLKKEAYDSGVHFRAELPAPKAHWPKKFQVNLKTDQEGNLTSIKSAASTGLYKNGEWNKFDLKVVGTTAELAINGKPAWKTDGIDTPTGYIGLQSEVTLGGQFEFRNIKIKELP